MISPTRILPQCVHSFLVSLLLCLVPLTQLSAEVLTVTNKSDDSTAPLPGSLRHAITTAANGDTIQFDASVTGTITLAGAEILLNKDLTISGAGASVLAISGNQQSRIFRVAAGTVITISGLTIRDGQAPNGADRTATAPPGAGESGGAIYNLGQITLVDCVLTNNSAGRGGNSDSGPFFGPSEGGAGGAVANISGVLEMRGCAITVNKAGRSQASYGGDGGGLSNFAGTIHLIECTISGNMAGNGLAGGSGGGVHCSGGDALFERCTIRENKPGYGEGGFIGSAPGGIGGGFAITNDSSVQINTCTISGNICGESGVGFDVFTSGTRIPTAGAGIYCKSSIVSVVSSTIYGNVGSTTVTRSGYFALGTGLYVDAASVTLSNTLVAQNKSVGRDQDVAGTVASAGYNLIGVFDPARASGISHNTNGDIAGAPSAPVDPRVGALTTFSPIAVHPLLPGSPAIDAGDDRITASDQRGQARPVGARVDIGAFELEYVPPPDVIVAFATVETNVSEVNGTATVSLVRAGNTASAASVQYSVSGGTASTGTDFTISGSTAFLPGETQRTITISAIHDVVIEGDETIELSLHSPSLNTTIGASATHVARIIDDVLPGRLAFAAASTAASEQTGKVLVSVVRTEGAIGEVSVAYQTSNGTADASDFTPASSVVTFAPGVMQQTIEIPILNDAAEEDTERFTISLSAPGGGATLGAQQTQTTTILDDDTVPNGAIFAVTNKADDRIAPPPGSLRHAIAAAANGDTIHLNVTGTITLAGAELVLDKNLTITGPGADVLAIIGNQQSRIFRIFPEAVVTISGVTARDGQALNGSNASAGEPGGGILNAGTLTLTNCVLSNNRAGSGGGITGTSSGGGGAGGDGGAIANSGSLFLERCVLTSNQAGAGGSFSSGIISASGAGGPGGNGGAISSTSGILQTVECFISANQAGVGGEGSKSAGSQTPRAGTGGSGGGIFAAGNLLVERCCISNNTSGNAGLGYLAAAAGNGGGLAVAGNGTGQVNTSTISGNRAGDAGPFQYMGSSGTGGSGGGISCSGNLIVTSCTVYKNTTGKFVPSLGSETPGTGGGIYSAGSVSARNCIVAGNRVPNGTVSDTNGNFVNQGHNLLGTDPLLAALAENGGPTPTHALLGNSPALDAGDDSLTGTDQRGQPRLLGSHVDIGAFEADPPVFSFASESSEVAEGAGSATVVLKRNRQIDTSASIQFSTASGTATAGADFTAISGAVSFAAGQTEATINIPILQDTALDPDESFQVVLRDLSGNPIPGPGSTHTVTIIDDEPRPTIAFAFAESSISEAGGDLLVTVLRKDNTTVPVSVWYRTANGSAISGNDYVERSGMVSFSAGATQQTIFIPIINDALVEPDETFTIELFAANGGAVFGNPTTHTVTIVSEDTPPTLSFQSGSSFVSESGGQVFVKVVRAGPAAASVSVSYHASAGSAEANADFTPIIGTLTFDNSITEQTLVIPILEDDLEEAPEMFVLTLSAPTNGAVLGQDASHSVTIISNDEQPSVAFAGTETAVQENGGPFTVTVVRQGNLDIAFTVAVTSNNGTATAGSDYSSVSQTLTFAPGVISVPVQVNLLNDSTHESSESFVLTLSQASTDVAIGTPSEHTVTILNDDLEPVVFSFAESSSSVQENAGTVLIVVARAGNITTSASVQISSTGGSATSGSDYTFTPATLVFSAGEIEKTFTITLLDNELTEKAETCVFTLSSPANGGTLGIRTTHTLTILDNDSPPQSAKARYHGLAERRDEIEYASVAVNMLGTGQLTGTLRIRGKTLPIRGRLSEEGTFSQTFVRSTEGSFPGGTLRFSLTSSGDLLIGTIVLTGDPLFELSAKRDKIGSLASPVQEANIYTALLETGLAGHGAGFLRTIVQRSGRISFTGLLADGTPLSMTSHVAEDGSFAFFAPCYGKASGYLAGPGQFALIDALQLSGDLRWFRPISNHIISYENAPVQLLGATFSPRKQERLLDDYEASNGIGTFRVSSFAEPPVMETVFLWNANNTLYVAPANSNPVRVLQAQLNRSSGLFRGIVRDVLGVRRVFRGAFVQQPGAAQDLAAGFYIIRSPGMTTAPARIEMFPENQ